MTESESTSLSDAIELALSILEPFRESSLYHDYQEADGWTDDQFQMALDVLTAAVASDGPHYLVVEPAKTTSGAVGSSGRGSRD
jgi:hypothetical protein